MAATQPSDAGDGKQRAVAGAREGLRPPWLLNANTLPNPLSAPRRFLAHACHRRFRAPAPPGTRQVFPLSRPLVPIRCGCRDPRGCPKGAAVTASWIRVIQVVMVCSAIAVVVGAQEFYATDLKAVFLLRFGSFMQWPTATDATPGDFVIGVLGEDPILPALETVVAGETVGGRRVRLVHYHGVHEVRDCEILFISRSRRDNIRHILHRLEGRPILTVSDSEGFTEAGGMVSFEPGDRRIRLRVNANAVREANITISSKLLRVAEIVDGPPSSAPNGA